MKAKDKSNLIVFFVIAAVLVENYLAYSCLFDGRRGYIELLLCGFFAHIVVAIIVGLNLCVIIPVDKATVKQCNNEEGNKDQHRQESNADGEAMPPASTLEAKSDNTSLQENISITSSIKDKTHIESTGVECALPITQTKSNDKNAPQKKPTLKPSITHQKVAPQVIAAAPMDMIAPLSPMPIFQDQRSWMASDIHRALMFDFTLREAFCKVLRRKGVSEELFYRKIASAAIQLHISTHELIDRLRMIQDDSIAMEEIVSHILLA